LSGAADSGFFRPFGQSKILGRRTTVDDGERDGVVEVVFDWSGAGCCWFWLPGTMPARKSLLALLGKKVRSTCLLLLPSAFDVELSGPVSDPDVV
jgi:hypothetical protein